MNLSELLLANQSIQSQLSKVEAEVVAKLSELQAAIDKLMADLADAPLTIEQAESVTEVQNAVQALDDIIPDVPPVA